MLKIMGKLANWIDSLNESDKICYSNFAITHIVTLISTIITYHLDKDFLFFPISILVMSYYFTFRVSKFRMFGRTTELREMRFVLPTVVAGSYMIAMIILQRNEGFTSEANIYAMFLPPLIFIILIILEIINYKNKYNPKNDNTKEQSPIKPYRIASDEDILGFNDLVNEDAVKNVDWDDLDTSEPKTSKREYVDHNENLSKKLDVLDLFMKGVKNDVREERNIVKDLLHQVEIKQLTESNARQMLAMELRKDQAYFIQGLTKDFLAFKYESELTNERLKSEFKDWLNEMSNKIDLQAKDFIMLKEVTGNSIKHLQQLSDSKLQLLAEQTRRMVDMSAMGSDLKLEQAMTQTYKENATYRLANEKDKLQTKIKFGDALHGVQMSFAEQLNKNQIDQLNRYHLMEVNTLKLGERMSVLKESMRTQEVWLNGTISLMKQQQTFDRQALKQEVGYIQQLFNKNNQIMMSNAHELREKQKNGFLHAQIMLEDKLNIIKEKLFLNQRAREDIQAAGGTPSEEKMYEKSSAEINKLEKKRRDLVHEKGYHEKGSHKYNQFEYAINKVDQRLSLLKDIKRDNMIR